MDRLINWFKELQRRKVTQVTGVYLVFAWGASLGFAELLPTFGAPDWVVQSAIIFLLALTPVVAALAWYFEYTKEGIVRDPEDMPKVLETEIAATQMYRGVQVRWNESGRTRTQYFSHDFTLGRDTNCDVTVNDPLASREHARVARQEGRWVIMDLGSSNGTLIDGTRVQAGNLEGTHAVCLGGVESVELTVFN